MAYGLRSGYASDVAHSWAHQQKDSWSKGNMFYNGRTIYSYGHHFPAATLLDDGYVAITTCTYSNTTARHLAKIREAVSHKNKIYCSSLPDNSTGTFFSYHHNNNIKHWIDEINNNLNSLVKARNKAKYISQITSCQAEAAAYINYFKQHPGKHEKVVVSKSDLKLLTTSDFSKYEEIIKANKEREARKEKALIRKCKKLHPVWLEAWRSGTENEFAKSLTIKEKKGIELIEFGDDMNRNRVRLRLNRYDDSELNTIQTTKDVFIPVEIAKRFYKKYMKVVSTGGCVNNCDYKMLDFNVNEMTAEHLLVGCHDIPRSEIDYIAGVCGWETPAASALESFIESADMPQ